MQWNRAGLQHVWLDRRNEGLTADGVVIGLTRRLLALFSGLLRRELSDEVR